MNAATLVKPPAMVKQSGRRAPAASGSPIKNAQISAVPAGAHDSLGQALWRAKAVTEMLSVIFLDGPDLYRVEDLMALIHCAQGLLRQAIGDAQALIPKYSQLHPRLLEAAALFNVMEVFEASVNFKFRQQHSVYCGYFDAAAQSIGLASTALELVPTFREGDNA